MAAYRPPAPPVLRGEKTPYLPTPGPMSPAWIGEFSKGIWQLLNQVKSLGTPPQWLLGDLTQDRLWAVHLHTHQWVYGLAAASKTQPAVPGLLRLCLSNWLAVCGLEKPGARATAWSPYVTATRIGWWVRAYLELEKSFWEPDPELEKIFLESLWTQASYLHSHIEWDLRGNHLMRDAVGLAWAGWFFQGPEADQWRETAAKLAFSQAQEQVLPDTGHFERSPMYHIQFMEDLWALSRLLKNEEDQKSLRKTLKAMTAFLAWARYPDGSIPLLNDGALNGAMPARNMLDLLEVSAAIPTGGLLFPNFGLAVWHGDPFSAFFDVGEVGPDVQPGHAHADTLSIGCSYKGQRLFVDPGTFAYDPDGRRRYDRATSSHNTVALDGKDSSEVWHIFRVGRRARPTVVSDKFPKDFFQVLARHDGYRYLRGRPVHERLVQTANGKALEITDTVGGRGFHKISGGFLLAPGWNAVQNLQGWSLDFGPFRLYIPVTGPTGVRFDVEKAPFHPAYGVEINTQRLVWSWEGKLPFRISLKVEEG